MIILQSVTDQLDLFGAAIQVLLLTLQYLGYATIMGGFIVWFTASPASKRRASGKWLTITGVTMVTAFFAYTTIVKTLKWIIEPVLPVLGANGVFATMLYLYKALLLTPW